MCGIVGMWNFDGEPVAEEVLISMRDQLVHRGPDDCGLWVDGSIGFGHRRLSILDLSPLGRQPMRHRSLPIVVTFNGEIYNFIEIRKELESLGHTFHSDCDTEVLLASYVQWGVQCLDRFNGMFAFALWDGRDRTLWLARDRYGKKPLFFALNGHRLLFASELRALRRVKDLSLSIDREAVYSYMEWRYIPDPASIYHEIRKLMPGRWMKVSADGTAAQHCYFDAVAVCRQGLCHREAKTGSDELDELERLLTDAIRLRMRSDVPYGALLSGGIDSSLVVALMTRIAESQVKTFSIGYRNSPVSEAEPARETATYLGTDHTELYVEPRDVIEIIPQICRWYDEPFADESAIPTVLVSQLARSRVTVALSGDGGDEFFAGYNYYRWAMQAARFNACVPRAVRECVARLSPFFRNDMLKKAIALVRKETPAQVFAFLSNPFKDMPLAKVVTIEAETKQERYERWMDTRRDLPLPESFMLHDIVHYLNGDILTKVDRASMSCSLETRCPLLDKEVTSFALRAPLSLKWRDGIQKYALKRLLYKYVPKEIMDRPKTGFGIPIGEWFRRDLKTWTEDLLFRRGYLDEFLNRKQLESMWREHGAGRRNHVSPLWGILVLQLWFETYHS